MPESPSLIEMVRAECSPFYTKWWGIIPDSAYVRFCECCRRVSNHCYSRDFIVSNLQYFYKGKETSFWVWRENFERDDPHHPLQFLQPAVSVRENRDLYCCFYCSFSHMSWSVWRADLVRQKHVHINLSSQNTNKRNEGSVVLTHHSERSARLSTCNRELWLF